MFKAAKIMRDMPKEPVEICEEESPLLFFESVAAKAERLWELWQLRLMRPVADPRGAVGARVVRQIGGARWERLRPEGLLRGCYLSVC